MARPGLGTSGRALLRRRTVLAGVVAVGSAGLAGCGSADADSPASAPASSSGSLLAERRAAGIQDCPVTDLDARAVAGGLPALVLDCVGGDSRVNLAGLPAGRPLLINFWASWCKPCRVEGPVLGEVHHRLGSRLVMLGVLEEETDPSAAVELARRAAMTYPQLVDTQTAARASLRVSAIPQSFLVAADGRIAYRAVQAFTSVDQVLKLVATHLGVHDG